MKIVIFRYSDMMISMNIVEVFKVLGNPTRLAILQNLREPEKHFPPQDEGDVTIDGVCVGSIQEGVGLSQSTTSTYLASLQRAGLVTAKRMGGWTYYKRNEANIKKLIELLGKEL
ncbi:helix-turn-helix transcriptional regulator [Rheinheimera pacifica]|uniref:ArsR/SmtB family transcription factor n=2 Tax=Rheinheimera pacifica TaxID=173990 RepID=UPI002ED7C18B